MPADIFDRIREALTGAPTSAEVAAVIAETKAALAAEGAARVEHEAVASDPLVRTAVAEAAGDKLVRSHATTKRLTAALDRLDPLLAATKHTEHQARIAPHYRRAKDERIKLLEAFHREYPRHVAAIVDLLSRMRAWDDAPVEVPHGEARLDSLQSDARHVLMTLNLPNLGAGHAWGFDFHQGGATMTLDERLAADRRRPGYWP